MIDIVLIYLISFLLLFISGFGILRYLDNKKSVINVLYAPLVGLSLIGILLQWMHLFFPLDEKLILVGLIPFISGMILIFKLSYNYHKIYIWLTFLILIISLIVLLPFFQIGYPTSFGITNNDAYWYTLADYRVSVHSFLDNSYDEYSQLISSGINRMQRYGVDYLSLLIQYITGYKSWEIVHILGGLGVVLYTFSFLIIGRQLKISFRFLFLLSILIPISSFVARLYYDAFIATFFGFSLFTAVISYYINLILRNDWNIKKTLFLSILTSGVLVYYHDIFLILVASLGIIGITTILTKRFKLKQFKYIFIYVLLTLILAFPDFIVIYNNLFFISSLPSHLGYFNLDEIFNTFIHLMGFSNFYNYMGNHTRIYMIIPSSIFFLLLIYGLYCGRRNFFQKNFIIPILLLFVFLFIYLLIFKQQEYSAHRIWMYIHSILIVLVVMGIQQFPRYNLRVILFIIIFVSFFFVYVKEIFRTINNTIIITTHEESSLDEFSKNYLSDGKNKLLINFDYNTHIFYGHYVYYQLVNSLKPEFKNNVILNSNQFTYLNNNTKINNFDNFKYILYLKNQYEDFNKKEKIVYENNRYIVIQYDKTTDRLKFSSGFYGNENIDKNYWQWMDEKGELSIYSAKAKSVYFEGELIASPGQKNIDCSIFLNGKLLFEYRGENIYKIKKILDLNEGENTLIIHSNIKPLLPGNGDQRKMTLMLRNYDFKEVK